VWFRGKRLLQLFNCFLTVGLAVLTVQILSKISVEQAKYSMEFSEGVDH